MYGTDINFSEVCATKCKKLTCIDVRIEDTS